MTLAGWLSASLSAVAAALLLTAGIAKLLSPAAFAGSAAELVPRAAGWLGPRLVRAFGAVECIAAVALLVAQARVPAAVAIAVLGAIFAVLGVLGLARGSVLPCGCLGAASRRPLGWLNIGAGAGLVLAGAVESSAGAPPASGYSAAAAMLTAIALVAGCGWTSRQLIGPVLRTRVASASGER